VKAVTRWLAFTAAAMALLAWNIHAEPTWQRVLSAFLLAWFAAFEAILNERRRVRKAVERYRAQKG
jgi:hypothetical protein